MNTGSRLYLGVVSTLFLATLCLAAVAGAAPSLDTLLRAGPWLALAILAEALVVHQENGTAGHLSFSAAVHVAAAIVFGPFLAAVIAALGVLIVDGGRGKNPYNVAFNASMLGLASGLGGAAYLLLGGQSNAVVASMAALAVLVICRFLANTFIFAGIISLSTGGSLPGVIEDEIWNNGLAGIGEGSLGVLLGLSVQHGLDYALPFLLPLLAAIYVAQAKYAQLWLETHKALDTFVEVIDERDPSTARHSERVTAYVERFSCFLGLSERQNRRLAESARYHDLGKVVVDVATLSSSRRLEPHDLAAIRSHARVSARLLNAFAFAEQMARYVELHHERFDGEGYYRVLAEQIPIEAHVLIIADSFDAMTSKRAYRPALTLQEAVGEILDKAGSQFHPQLASAFAAMMQGASLSDALSDSEIVSLRATFGTPRRFALRIARLPAVPILTLAAVTAPLAGLAAPDMRLAAAGIGVASGICALAMSRVRRQERSLDASVEENAPRGGGSADIEASRSFLIALNCFDRIRTAAGQLTAQRVVAEAQAALLELVGTHGTVRLGGDDQFLIRLGESVWHEIVPAIAPALAGISVPTRVDPISVATTFLDGTEDIEQEAA